MEEVKIVKEMGGLQDQYPGGKDKKGYEAQTWLEGTSIGSSNHPVQDPHEILSGSNEPTSNPWIGPMLMGMVVTRGDEEGNSSCEYGGEGHVENAENA